MESTSASNQSNVPITVGQAFPAGAITPADTIVGRLRDGAAVPLQVDVKARHPDGSLRHAVISAKLPQLVAGQAALIDFVKAAASESPGSTPQTLLSAGFTAGINVTIGGQLYTASADSLLRNGTPKPWLSGAIANEWLVSAPLTAADGTKHPHLTARFAIRSYAGLNKAKVDVILENNWAYETAPQDLTYDVQVVIGGQTVYSKTAMKHYHHARWRKSLWWGTEPAIHVKHDTDYLIATKAVPNYDQTVTVPPTAITAMKTSWTGPKTEPMGTGMADPYMPGTGGREDIGILPGWTVKYLLSMDRTAKDVTLGTADLSGSWSIHYRDKNTDRPVSLVDYPYMTLLGSTSDTLNPATKKQEAFPACGGTCANPSVPDGAHQPSLAYVPYLLTGDHYYLEELQFWTMWSLFQSNPGYRQAGKALVNHRQVRDQAWTLRTLSHAAYISPDDDPLKPQFSQFLTNNVDWYNSTYTNNSTANALGIIPTDPAIVYDNYTGIAPWQDDFFTQSIGVASELGNSEATQFLRWKAKFPVSRMVDGGYCWIRGAAYSVRVRDARTSPLYTSMTQVYQASFPSTFTSLACGSADMATNLGLKVGEMTGYSYSTVGYPSNLQPALAYAVDARVSDSAKAWQVFMGRTVKPNYGDGPQFAIVPR